MGKNLIMLKSGNIITIWGVFDLKKKKNLKFLFVLFWKYFFSFLYNISGHENVKETVAEFLTERLHTPKAIEGKNLNFQAGTFDCSTSVIHFVL